MCRPSHAQCIGAVDEFEVKAAMKKGFNATTKSNYLEPSQLRPAVRLALDFVGPLGGRVSDGEPGRGGGGRRGWCLRFAQPQTHPASH
jgi:hypothetical protein